ncbi:hypothetical protein [Amycolatopsis cihanbeyliensis]|uniref:Lipoprotein LprG n=1 Tax=Amycolatopsis cihanbeyliensis TaxID=1128664 RepID=A0A542DHH7_AMYCI|nr:hypothetical protein [Amycolatopsis cihanbeyliensis]TQJ02537.1 hypothetical protein FB471_2268 [Amycolatopsis cihanbeyliensis]
MRKTALAAGGFALVLALTGCGGESVEGQAQTYGNAQELVQAALTGTEKSQTAKFTFDMSVAGMNMKANGEGRFDSENPAMSMTMDMLGQNMEMRLVGDALYIKQPQATGDKPWTKASKDSNDPMSRAMGGKIEEMTSQMDVRNALDQVKAAGTIKSSEQTELNGQPATHYVIDLDFQKLLEQESANLPQGMNEQMAGKVDKLPMELWLSEDELPLQVTMDMAKVMEAAGAPAGQGGKVTMTYSDWGAPVNIEAPPADQVQGN